MNPFTKTIGLGQSGIIPDATIAGILTLSLDGIGFSLDKQLRAETLNDMWDNSGAPAPIQVPGHLVVRGSGNIGFKATEKIDVSIEIDATLLVDADYNNTGRIPQVFRYKDDDISDIGFALLFSGSAYPKFNVTSVLKDGSRLAKVIDLKAAFNAKADVFTLVNGNDSALQGMCVTMVQANQILTEREPRQLTITSHSFLYP